MRTLLLTLLLTIPIATASAEADRTAFDAAFTDYRTFVKQIEDLRNEYQTANQDRQNQINVEAMKLVHAAQPKVNKMVEEALKHYQAAPESDPQITNLLVAVAGTKLMGSGKSGQGGDQFETVLEIVRALTDGGNKTEELPTMGVIAAFCCNEYDLVEKYAGMAKPSSEKTRLNEDLLGMAADYSDPSRLAEYRELWAKEKESRDAEATADDLPRVKFETSNGDIVIELFENEAPTAVANFVTLVKSKHYDGLKFHRVLPHFMAQGGDPSGDGSGGPGYCIPCECYQENARMHFRGSLSMAHAGRDTGGSQFFLTFVPTHHLNGRHTVFGRVIEGMEVLGEIQRVEPGERGVSEGKILKATVLRDRGHDYKFKKLPPR